MNLYRVTVRNKEGEISDHETKAASLFLAVQHFKEPSAVVSVERINPATGQVLSGFYNE